MQNKVLIVESPNKVKTIQKYVGSNYNVLSSVGHILKLSTSGESNLGIDFEKWEPKMIVDRTKSKIIKELKDAVLNADEVLIATDPDREGEAIAQNLVDVLKVENKYKRIKYNEITKEAIEYALNHPLEIDKDLVNAQKTRRMMDRIIGFKLSQLMKQKVKNTPTIPSAGRVQSIALKLVCDKEKEIKNFIPTLYSKITAKINDYTEAVFFYDDIKDFDNDNTWINRDKVDRIYNTINQKMSLLVTDFKITKRRETQITPFKQSVLYKEAKYSSSIVQVSAQKLFEKGLISYPRTDSTRMSESFIQKAKKYIENVYGIEYVASEIKGFSGTQDAHEAIRPTDVYLTPNKAISEYDLNEVDAYIYELIYNKTLSSIMTVPQREVYSYELQNSGYKFRMSYSKVIFKGYYELIGYEQSKEFDKYEIGDEIDVQEYIKSDKETLPPSRYNEGSLIKMLDDIKVGRPSTFASTVNVIKQRLFVENINNQLHPTHFGLTVLDKLINGFSKTINEEYTAHIEEKLDRIAEGQEDYINIISNFYNKFIDHFEDASKTMEISILPQEFIEEKCPECNGDLLYRYTKIRKEKFIACSNFPKCRYTRALETTKKRRFFRKSK
ncbi:DNA topoisomerase 1 [Metamycoplasma cloacale]|uniref:DNA topoisomerase 1 n=1 Tax=Metamycoplasma cloacale TaxID=92401 RepID=A0A2Z4LMF8_9BACT|nr:type I DNA topoisomerase [Metamycoplasma cloacale]AWX42844.1 type I DNA topoisomerase [Metamycoplasma cloacale]VEU79335.1 DNA topoisomerase 1 [Metamycoplasma cloacale]